MKFSIIVLAITFLGQTANANCDDLIKKHRVEAPAFEQIVLWPEKGYFGCTKEQTAMFHKNYNAIERAELPKTFDDLVGTWLGDDVIPSLLGLVIYSQEVIKVEKGVQDETLLIEQYLYQGIQDEVDKVSLPRWKEGKGYSGLIRKITLKANTDPNGKVASWQVLSEVRSPMRLFQDDDTNQLLDEYYDRFENGLKLSLVSNKVLVVAPKVPSNSVFGAQTTTYTKVRDNSPDLAILLLTHFNQDLYESFECFTHQISDENGVLIDQLKPLTLQEVEKGVSDVVLAEANANKLSAMYRKLDDEMYKSGASDKASERQLSELKEKVSAAFRSTSSKYAAKKYKTVKEVMENRSNLGCDVGR